MTEILETEPARRGRVPTWLAAVVILIVVVAGGYWVYQMAFASKDKVTADVMEIGPAPEGFGGRRNGAPQRSLGQIWGLDPYPQGVTRQPSGAIVARQGDAYARAYMAASGSYVVTLEYLSRSQWVTPVQWQMHRRLDEATMSRLGLNDAQRGKIKALDASATLTPAERKNFEALFREWESAKEPVAKTAVSARLLPAVSSAAAAHLAETKAAMLKRVETIPQILTTQQIAQLRTGMTSSVPSSPATRPTRPGAMRPQLVPSTRSK